MANMDCSTLKAGDTLFYVTRENKPKQGIATITKIRRKYIYVDFSDYRNRQFEKDDLFDYHNDVKFYPDRQSYLDQVESNNLKGYIRKCFTDFPRKSDELSLEQLRRIASIIEESRN